MEVYSPTELIQRLTHCKVCAGFSSEELSQFAQTCQILRLAPDAPLKQSDDDEFVVYTVLHGRLKMYHRKRHGIERDMGFINPGETLGQSSLVLKNYNKHIRVMADTEVTLVVVPRASTLKLLADIDRFRYNLFDIFRNRADSFLSGKIMRRFPKTVAVVAARQLNRTVIIELAHALVAADESVAIFTDQPRQLEPYAHLQRETRQEAVASITLVPLTVDSVPLDQRVREQGAKHTRTLLDIDPLPDTTAVRNSSLWQCIKHADEVLWCCDNTTQDQSLERLLQKTTADHPQLIQRSRCLQLLGPGVTVGRRQRCCTALQQRDLILPQKNGADANGLRLYQQGLQRIVHYLQGIKTGLALGGGGARGISHFGVLNVFDQANLHFDMMSGTSIGALVGLGYAAGYEPIALMRSLASELKVGRRIEQLPSGQRLYLFGKFQGDSWEPLIRSIFHDWTFEQLPVPFSVAVTDLVAGEQLIRDSGDITTAILESINVPILSSPILRAGKILVDGGVLNNLPADLLRAHAVEYIVGVNASKSISRKFAGNHAQMPLQMMKSPNRFETAYRVLDVTRHGMAQAQMSLADSAIEPDTSAFDFADFSKSEAITQSGADAAQQQLPEILEAIRQLRHIGPAQPPLA